MPHPRPKGVGKGWRNVMPDDPHRHALAAKGIKSTPEQLREPTSGEIRRAKHIWQKTTRRNKARKEFEKINPKGTWFEAPKNYLEYEQTKQFHRFRMRDPEKFANKIYSNHKRETNPKFITKYTKDPDKAIIRGRLKEDPYGKLTEQAIIFRKVPSQPTRFKVKAYRKKKIENIELELIKGKDTQKSREKARDIIESRWKIRKKLKQYPRIAKDTIIEIHPDDSVEIFEDDSYTFIGRKIIKRK